IAVGLVTAGRLRVDEQVSGPAVVRKGAPATCVVVASLPASRVASIHAGSKGRFTEETSSPSSLPLVLERVDARSVSAATVTSQDRGASQGGAMVTVVARLERRAGNVEDGPTACAEGARGRLEVDLPPRRLLSLLLPESLRPE